MPDYQIDQAKREVVVKIYGKLQHERYDRARNPQGIHRATKK